MIIPPLVLVAVRPTVAAPKGLVPNITAIGWFIGNPDPSTLIFSAFVVPTAPELGVTEIEDTVVLKLIDAVLK